MGKFDSYFDPPEYPDPPCALCGAFDCACEPENLKNYELAVAIGVLEYRLHELKRIADTRKEETEPCPKCGKPSVIDVFTDHEVFCCGFEWYGNPAKWEDSKEFENFWNGKA